MATATAPRLIRRPFTVAAAPQLDAAQRNVVEHGTGPLLVLAGPGTGKTTTIVEAVATRISAGQSPESALVLTFGRRAAQELRQRISARLGRATVEPLARTFHSYAFGVLHRAAAAAGDAPPRLLSGAEQDRVVRELLAGDVAAGARDWPAALRPALLTRGFAQEVRDFLLRCAERGINPEQVYQLGASLKRAEWQAVASFAQQYSEVKALAFPGALDPAELVRAVLDLWGSRPDLLARERETLAAVYVDELQDADPAQLQLLEALGGGGRLLVVVGDPDQSIYAFRGADPDGVRTFADRFTTVEGRPAPVVCLRVSRRSGADLLRSTRRLAERLGGRGPHRALSSPDPGGRSEVRVLRTTFHEAAYIAARLRECHLRDHVPWERMAVLVRSAPVLLPGLRRALADADVPVAPVRGDAVPLPEHAAVSSLLLLLRCADSPAMIDEDIAERLLLSPYGGADALTLRRLRAELRGLAAAAEPDDDAVGVSPLPDDSSALASVLGYGTEAARDRSLLDPRLRRPADRVAALLQTATEALAAGASVEEVLWAVWARSGLAPRWTEQSAASGRRGAAACADLDAILGLFDAAGRFADRLPQAGIGVFLDEMASRELPELGRSNDRPTAGVSLMTAHAAKGLEWDVVVIAGVQEGTWPDLRRRGSLLAREELLQISAAGATDPGAAMQERSRLLADERRLFYVAATRARRQLVVTAVLNEREELVPSGFLDELDPPSDDAPRQLTDVPRALELSALVAELRAVLLSELAELPELSAGAAHRGAAVSVGEALSEVPELSPGAATTGAAAPAREAERTSTAVPVRGAMSDPPADGECPEAVPERNLLSLPPRAAAAARHLAQLAAEGVPGADPTEWYDLAPLSDDRSLREPDEPVAVSPSRVEAFARCQLRWFLEEAGGSAGETSSAGVGSAVHAVAAAAESLLAAGADDAALQERLEAALAAVDLGQGWSARRGRGLAEDMVRRLAAWIASNRRTFAGAEIAFAVDVGRARLTGRVDRLDLDDDGRPVVIDFKTGSSAATASELPQHPQLGAYQLAVARGAFDEVVRQAERSAADLPVPPEGVELAEPGGVEPALPGGVELAEPDGAKPADPGGAEVQPGGAELVQLGGGATTAGAKVQQQAPLQTSEDPLWPERLVVSAAEGMAGSAFVAMTNKLCRVCPVQTSCPVRPEGRMVGR